MTYELAQRLQSLPPYLFAELDRKRGILAAQGMELINLTIGDPDLPTPEAIVASMVEATKNPKNHQYPAYNGSAEFRQASCDWMQTHYNVSFDADAECLACIGSKEGIAHLPWTFCNAGDVVLVPDPGYPVYSSSAQFAEAVPYTVPLEADGNFLPNLDAIPEDICAKAKILFLNYPNNPTAACATREFFAKAVAFAKQHNIIIAHDAAYMEIFYDGKRPLSIFEVEGAKDVAIEFHSLSKTFNMTGWRLGFVVGNADIVQGLSKMKTNLDSGVFTAVQEAGITALTTAASCTDDIRAIYQERRDVLVPGLQKLGLDVTAPDATFYVWTPVPTEESSAEFVTRVMESCGVILTPGLGFGAFGDRYFRFTLCADSAVLEQAVAKLGTCL